MSDALDLLRRVSDTYRTLRTLAVEASVITESGDENQNSRSEQRVAFHYSAPNRFRFEPRGRHGAVQVCDGSEFHSLFHHPRGEDRYHRLPAGQLHPLPHQFRSDLPFSGDSFVYQGIEENVVAAELLREDDGRYVVSATYAPPQRPHFAVTDSPVRFWIDAASFLIVRQEGEVGHRLPTQDEIQWNRHTSVVHSIRANEPIPDEFFQFTPPPGVTADAGGRCGISVGGGGGSISRRPGGDMVEHSSSHEWQADTLVERSRWKLRGHTLQFERRLTFSADGKELQVAERLTGPKGDVETQSALPLD
jgi:outer membrane lipoprotein-sorting protein